MRSSHPGGNGSRLSDGAASELSVLVGPDAPASFSAVSRSSISQPGWWNNKQSSLLTVSNQFCWWIHSQTNFLGGTKRQSPLLTVSNYILLVEQKQSPLLIVSNKCCWWTDSQINFAGETIAVTFVNSLKLILLVEQKLSPLYQFQS